MSTFSTLSRGQGKSSFISTALQLAYEEARTVQANAASAIMAL
jgi:hypothetical protein